MIQKMFTSFDETSFVDVSGMRTVSTKRTSPKQLDKNVSDPTQIKKRTDQPCIKNYVGSNQRISIGCVITQTGEKLDPIITVKGKT